MKRHQVESKRRLRLKWLLDKEDSETKTARAHKSYTNKINVDSVFKFTLTSF